MVTSPRLRFRRLNANDFANMRLLDANPKIMINTPRRVPQTEEQTRERLATQIASGEAAKPFGIWVTETLASGDFVGWCMLRASDDGILELGYMLNESFWNQGFASEMAQALVEFARAQGERELKAVVGIGNLPSMRVLEKAGFVPGLIERLEESMGAVELRHFKLQL